jgi:hypothetical protein
MAEDAKRTAPIRADAILTDDFILTVDGKLKARYETDQDAATLAAKLKVRFPAV